MFNLISCCFFHFKDPFFEILRKCCSSRMQIKFSNSLLSAMSWLSLPMIKIPIAVISAKSTELFFACWAHLLCNVFAYFAHIDVIRVIAPVLLIFSRPGIFGCSASNYHHGYRLPMNDRFVNTQMTSLITMLDYIDMERIPFVSEYFRSLSQHIILIVVWVL